MSNSDMREIQNQVEQTSTSEMDGRFLTFFTDSQLFGVPISDVVQIVGMQDITPIPEFPYYAKGIINLRGEIIPVIDMRLRLNREETDYNERTCIINTSINDRTIGLIVDSVDEVSKISDDQIAEPPKMSEGSESYITGIGKLEGKVVLLMDTKKLLGNDELEWMEDTATVSA